VASPLLDRTRPEDGHVQERLAAAPVIWLGSTRPDGRPHHVPVWFLWEDPTILLFARAGTQKLRNIAAHPAVGLHLDTAAGGADVVLAEGRAEQLAAGERRAADTPGFTAKYGAMVGDAGWDGWSAAFTQPVLITVTRVVAWVSTPEGPRTTIRTA
jgi:PPOX class probable F420-dependent enzyme